MGHFSRILAATDLSAPARHAAERAAMLARDNQGALDLLHVVHLAPLQQLLKLLGTLPADVVEQVLDSARQQLGSLAGALEQRFGVAAGVHVVAGALLAEFAGQADALSADLLVCGAKGESRLRPLVLGTTALRMLNMATTPTLVVKQAPREPYKKILVPVDFSQSSAVAIRDARRIAPGARIVLLHVFEILFEGHMRHAGVSDEVMNHYVVVAKQKLMEQLRELRAGAGLSDADTRLLVLHGYPFLRIIEQEQECDCDLIVMGKHGENRLLGPLLGSVTEQVLNESQADVLVSV